MRFTLAEDQWFAVHVRSNAEQTVGQSLTNKGFEIFIPTYSAESIGRRPRIRKARSMPLFPGYVFFRALNSRPGMVVTTPGLIRILGTANGPSSIGNDQIDALKRFVQLMIKPEVSSYLAIGRTVRIARGPLAGLRGAIVKVLAGYRFVISIELLQRSVSVLIDGASLGTDEDYGRIS